MDVACRYLSLAVALVAVLAVASSARADVPPLSVAQTQRLEDQGVRDIIVKHRPDLSSSERADLRADADVTHLRNLVLRDAELVRAPTGQLGEAVRELSADPDVVYAEPNQPVQAATADPYWSLLWALENTGQTVNGAIGTAGDDVHAPGAWAQSTGTGQTVAVVDTGVESAAPDLEGQFATNSGETGTDSQSADKASNGVDDDGDGLIDDWRGWDFVDGDNTPGDQNGHGSHVSGIVAALKDNDVGGVGIAPTAKVMALRVLGANGQGTAAAVASAFEYGGEQGVAVVNASLGSSGPSQAEEDAISSHPNTLYVVSAGNGGSDSVGDDNDQIGFWPCVLPEPNVVCVGATDANDTPASFSNHGATSVDLSAPGVNIVSTWINSAGGSPQYYYSSGTSMATAFVAGTLALMRARNPGLDAAALKADLLASADQRASLAGESVSTGRLNAAAAVLAASPVDSDGDGVPDNNDNCTQAANSDQADLDADGLGDACDPDPDRDGDGYPNGEDAFPDDPSEHADGDSDGVGDHADNCPSAPNPAQEDQDGDGLGDACDAAPNGTGSTDTGDGGANQTGGSQPTGAVDSNQNTSTTGATPRSDHATPKFAPSLWRATAPFRPTRASRWLRGRRLLSARWGTFIDDLQMLVELSKRERRHSSVGPLGAARNHQRRGRAVVQPSLLEAEIMRAAIPTAKADYPTKLVRMIEPFGPGSGPEVVATAVGRRLAELWGQPVTVENHPGAGSTAAPAMVATSPADGYTLLVHTNAHAYSAALVTNLPYDPLTDFVAVAALTTQSYVLVAGETTGLATVGALIAAARAKPGQLRFGSSGVGTGTHLGIENFNLAAGIDATHVPARGSDAIADTIANTIAGRTDYALSPIPTTLPHIRAGRLLPLGLSSARRSNALPDVPTVAEAGVPGFEFPIWYGSGRRAPLQPESFRRSPRTSRALRQIPACAPRS